MAKTKVKGVMALSGADLAKLVDDTVAALRVKNPTWLRWYGDNLPAHVQQIILEGAATARKHEEFQTGGVRIHHDKEGEFTEVWVLVGTVYDEGTLHDPDDAGRECDDKQGTGDHA